ncbi:MAG: hypothetical protein HWE11_04480 [Gammaproteobacteria bacterium]|nr:hypothetical protein [Gammaproteobacteria bacterium]
MVNKNNVERSQKDLFNALQEQVLNLISLCKVYDEGQANIGKLIAATLRTLLHQTGNSHALINQLELKNIFFYDSTRELDNANMHSECLLCVWQLQPGSSTYVPRFILDNLIRENWVESPLVS